MDEIKYTPIGIIHSPFKEIRGMPIQPSGAKGIKGTVKINLEYVGDLEEVNIGWLNKTQKEVKKKKSDYRFK